MLKEWTFDRFISLPHGTLYRAVSRLSNANASNLTFSLFLTRIGFFLNVRAERRAWRQNERRLPFHVMDEL
jgi:hypothetical protein